VLSGFAATLLLSDVHLSEERPARVERFLEVLAGPACQAGELYILGDLFEYWIGDDDCTAPFAARIIGALRSLADQGCRIHFLHGNRDFLIGPEFAARAGLNLLEDPVCVALQGVPTLLMHGDLLCTEDTAYLAFRAQVRAPAWQQQFLAQDRALRHAMARGATAESGRAKELKSEAIMDVTTQAVADAFRRSGCVRLIHGHTHRPGHHVHQVDGQPRERWVLPDWYGPGGYLRVTPDHIEDLRFGD
jgi:UDP-2,3-diacylglucosamine hydrolase